MSDDVLTHAFGGLVHELILREAATLLQKSEGDGLNIGDLEISHDVLYCNALPRSVGGLRLVGMLMEKSLAEFSCELLVPWLTRMARLKALYFDLKMLGVAND